ncbi:DUF192 domain-containing protein [Aquibacillus koreensis]|uniref:DUF192 domain-containing protein n=1 Tax=Aquibacillus koreensis TaxID=279446 RepID=A0A9X3WLV9_9BACI|nr:DUF192 domain-containing protein [Aquibacillus koreensis]MCT2534808.1 DUF192 domain-containing protein [Aquibacillus koreensis]MDC3419581.1 DUF192 domain-containing protein [Aquibacillus koreensis]
MENRINTKIIKIVSRNRETKLTVGVADTQRKREQGLQFVMKLPENAGMLFVFPKKTYGGFWMKNTFIPLSIAFLDWDGSIIRILDMEPCYVNTCPMYDPGIFYHYAIEVNRGWFEKNQIEEGDYVRLF